MPHRDRWEFYQDKQNDWRWRRKAVNGRIVGASSEGYRNRTDCVDNATRNGFDPNDPHFVDYLKL
jgi:uncharacterized protein YegP (UPF0339 family)